MIFGNVRDFESSFTWLPKPLKTAVEHLKQTDFNALPAGNYDLQGKGYRLVYLDMRANLILNDVIPAMLKGESDMALLDVPDLIVGMEKWPAQIKVIGPISEVQEMAVGFRKNSPALRGAFNEFFSGLLKDGTYMKLVNKYFRAAPRYFPAFFKQREGGY